MAGELISPCGLQPSFRRFHSPSSGWSTIVSGSGGTITITSLTQDEIAGTFSFTAKGILNAPATSIKTVTSGKFDLPVKK